MSMSIGEQHPHSLPPLAIALHSPELSQGDAQHGIELTTVQPHLGHSGDASQDLETGESSRAVRPSEDASTSSLDSGESAQMKRQTRASAKLGPQAAEGEKQNGEAMPFLLEHRRRHSAAGENAAASIMSRHSFSLDDEPPTPKTPSMHDDGAGFFELPDQDRRNFLLLVLLYFLQGIPMGLAGGSVPFLLKSHLSYGQIGVFSLAIYPYSLKLLWSPIVDAVWSPKMGRRKSWILPVQMVSGISMLFLGSRIEGMMVAAGANGGSGVWSFTVWWFLLVFTCATQDIAVDGRYLWTDVCCLRC